MKVLKVLSVLTLLLIIGMWREESSIAQDRARRARTKSAGVPLRSFLSETAEEIKNVRPELSYEALYQDGRAIEASLPAIRYIFIQRGFDDKDAEKATLVVWRQLREAQLQPQEVLSPRDMVVYTSRLGKLVIKSVPIQADVELNNMRLSEQTTVSAWLSPGKYTVRFSKLGYTSVEATCEVEEGKKTEIQKELPRNN